jgi:drug/metabolite transporter (DMT)-like permease
MAMTTVTLVFGIVLVVLGVGGYAVTGGTSLTALIPAAFGIVMAVLGWFGRNEKLRRHLMHAAAVLGLVGFAATARGIGGALTLLSGGEVSRPEASVVQALMAIVCAVYLGFAVRSFILARRRTTGGEH